MPRAGTGYAFSAECALALLRGPIGLAEAQVLETSRLAGTAMAFIPREPPGRLTSQTVRSLKSGRGRIVVVATDGRLAPGNFERLLRVSIPDVESDVDVVESSGGLIDAIEAAETAGLYRSGDSLQVFCAPSDVARFERELTSSDVLFDSTVISVSALPGRLDDPDEVIDAVHDRDESRMERLLDPHVFSDGGVEDYRAVLFREGLLREFLSDIAPSRELAIDRLHDILSAEMPDEVGSLKYLGSGRNGSAYRHPDGFIVKVTTDSVEASSARKLEGASTDHLGRIYQVRPVADGVWMIIQEDLERLPEGLRVQFDGAMAVVEECGAIDSLNSGGVLDALSAVRERAADRLRAVAEVVRRFDVVKMCYELRRLGLTADFHSGNVMLRGDRPVLVDLGTPGDDPGDLQEYGTGAPGSGASSPATMRASNSSSWSNGRGALKAPQNHVPEDENEVEGDRAMDWGPGRITGASF